MASKAALWAHADLAQSLLLADAIALSNEVGGLHDAGNHLVGVLKSRELGSDDAENDVLVAWEMLERLEAAGARGVIFEVVGVYVKVLEEWSADRGG
jgi:hypothetical protein